MRHRKSFRKFSRNTSHRRAMFRNLAANLVLHERIDSEETRADHEHGWNGCLRNLESSFADVDASPEGR